MFDNQPLDARKRRQSIIRVRTMGGLTDGATHAEIAGHQAGDNLKSVARKPRSSDRMVDTSRVLKSEAPITEIAGQINRGHQTVSARKRQARVAMQTKGTVPDALISDIQPAPPREAERRGAKKSLKTETTMPLATTIAELRELQKTRQFCIKQQSRCDRSVDSFIARFLGYQNDLPEEQRKKIFDKAASIREKVEKGGLSRNENHEKVAPEQVAASEADIAAACAPIVLTSAQGRAGWDKLRDISEKRMTKIAQTLPAWEFVQGVRGFGPLGLAIVIGETGDLANYRTKEKVWKRLGLAVINGERQQKKTGEEGILHGYNPKRRAEMWTLFTDSMFRAQWNADKDEDSKDPKKTKKPVAVPAHPAGPYGEIYAARRAHTVTREWIPAHCKYDALRIMTKAVIEDLWRVWNGKNPIYAKAPPSP